MNIMNQFSYVYLFSQVTHVLTKFNIFKTNNINHQINIFCSFVDFVLKKMFGVSKKKKKNIKQPNCFQHWS